jgi:predicted CXXCH cytochrome family protein
LIALMAVFLTGFLMTDAGESRAASDDTSAPAMPAFVSSESCAECHADAFKAWRDSHHGWALREPTEGNVLGDFDDAVFESGGIRSRFFRRDGSYFVETDGADGKPAEYEIKYTVGVTPLQQYLVETEKGRLQALDIAWDIEKQRWFHLYPDEKLRAGDGLHWTGPYKNWQARCAECHQTDFVKGYAPRQRAYQSRWSELTVGCESCHGPGEAHVAWARNPAAFAASRPEGVDDLGLAVAFAADDPEKEIQTCAPCHSRRGIFGADSPPPGSRFADHFRLSLLTEGLYHADGQIDGEVYVYGSFLQSKMYARGVRCSNCHEPHSGALRAEGNAVCAQCHNPDGNAAFPTLRKAAYDDPSHHHHAAGSEGAKCANCHMPEKTYMQVDPRRDHSFRVPRPDLTRTIGTPNACAGCHDDKNPQWAVARLEEWFPDGRTGTPHYGEVLNAGRTRRTTETAQKLIGLALDGEEPAIARATALNYLQGLARPEDLERLSPLLGDDNALLRASILPLYQAAPADVKRSTALSMIEDPARSVRIEAAKLFLGTPLNELPDNERGAAQRAIAAYQGSLLASADYPETQMQIAGLSMTLRQFEAAQAAFREAVEMDPQLAQAWITLARIQWALQRPAEAIATLEKAARKVPGDGDVLMQLGALYLQQRQNADAVAVLEKRLKLAGPSADLLDMLAMSHFGAGDTETARKYAQRLAREFPAHRPSPLAQQLLQIP